MRCTIVFFFHALVMLMFGLSPTYADTIDFGDPAFAHTGSTTYVDGGSGTASALFSFDVLDSSFSTAGGPDGVDDICITFRAINGPNIYSGGDNFNTTRSTATSSGHTMLQSSSGIRGRSNHGNNVASRAATGDVVGYEAIVRFKGFNVSAADLAGVGMTSINTAGEAFESTALSFLDSSGNAYGTASYSGFWDTPPIGATGGSTSPTVNANPWTATGPGVFIADDTGIIDVTDPYNPVADSSGPDNNATVSASSTGLAATDLIGGFSWMVMLEDVASLDSDGDGVPDVSFTTTATSFTGTLNELEFFNAKAVPEPGSAGLMLILLGGVAIRRRKR